MVNVDMAGVGYEWDEAKNRANITKHGVSFEAAEAFDWTRALEIPDEENSGEEERVRAIGFIGLTLCVIAFTFRTPNIRVISLRKATKKERKLYDAVTSPELTKSDFARARPAIDRFPPEMQAAIKRKRGERGPGKKLRKEAISLRLDPDVVAYFKAGGKGWQTRINIALKSCMANRKPGQKPEKKRA